MSDSQPKSNPRRVFLKVLGYGLLTVSGLLGLACLAAYVQQQFGEAWGAIVFCVGSVVELAIAAAIFEVEVQ